MARATRDVGVRLLPGDEMRRRRGPELFLREERRALASVPRRDDPGALREERRTLASVPRRDDPGALRGRRAPPLPPLGLVERARSLLR